MAWTRRAGKAAARFSSTLAGRMDRRNDDFGRRRQKVETVRNLTGGPGATRFSCLREESFPLPGRPVLREYFYIKA
jgi:hypothetical protein